MLCVTDEQRRRRHGWYGHGGAGLQQRRHTAVQPRLRYLGCCLALLQERFDLKQMLITDARGEIAVSSRGNNNTIMYWPGYSA